MASVTAAMSASESSSSEVLVLSIVSASSLSNSCSPEIDVTKKFEILKIILLTSSNNQISEFRIPNIYNEISDVIFLMILRIHFEASLRFRKN